MNKGEIFNLSTPYWETPWSPIKDHDFLSPYFNMICQNSPMIKSFLSPQKPNPYGNVPPFFLSPAPIGYTDSAFKPRSDDNKINLLSKFDAN